MKKVLEMVFNTEASKEVTLSVQAPKDDLTKAAVQTVMQSIIDKHFFAATTAGELVSIKGCDVRVTDVQALV